MTGVVLRAGAIAIAVAAVIDPSVAMSGAARTRVAVVVAGSEAVPTADVRARVVDALGRSFEIVPHITSDVAAAVVIGDRYPDGERIPDTIPAATVTVADAATDGVRIVAVETPREVPPATAIRLDVTVEGTGVAGRSTEISARIGGLEVGRASHQWNADRGRWRARMDVVPVGEPPWVVSVTTVRLRPDTTSSVESSPSVVSGFSRTVDTVVDLRRAPLRVTFYDGRPSWASTFVRRALEEDRRFEVGGTSFSSRGIAARTGEAVALGDPRIDNADAIVVGGLDRVSAADVRALDRFMRVRGGAVVLVPDTRIDGATVRDLLPFTLTERLLERPATLAMLDGAAVLEASEMLVAATPPAGEILAGTTGADAAAVVVSTPHGAGRLVVSGAMDAWRFRGAAFDRFWQSAIAGLAQAVPPPIDVAVEPRVLRPLGRGAVVVRIRSGEYTPLVASLDGNPLRLYPDRETGVFRGTFIASAQPGRSTIDIRAAAGEPQLASRTVIVNADARVPPDTAPLAMLAATHRGIDVTADRIGELEPFLRAAVVAPHAQVVGHPMRSVWWMVPFTVCLSAEWWLRRRRGLR
jgi:hypothetical protein